MSSDTNPDMKNQTSTEHGGDPTLEYDDQGRPCRRVKIIMINAYEFVPILTKGMKFKRYTEIAEGIPADAEIQAMSADTARHGIMFVIKSAEYPLVPIEKMPPIQRLDIQTQLKNATKARRDSRKKKR